MQRKLVIANWKAYVTGRKQAAEFMARYARGIRKVPGATMPEIVFCAPFPLIQSLPLLRFPKTCKGGQNVFWESSGPYTGEVTAAMLKDAGAEFVIVGHSERRRISGETDEMVQKKLAAAVAAKLNAVLCVGEKEKTDDEHAALEYIRTQLRIALGPMAKSGLGRVVVAYEPVWAISGGGGEADTPENAARMIMFIRRIISRMYDAKTAQEMRVLYGGSVTSKNVGDFVSQDGIDGVLVGSASAKPKEFAQMTNIIARLSKGK